MTNRPARRRGQALVEIAFALPIFLMVLCGCIDLGRWVFAQNELNQAVGAASRAISVEGWQGFCSGASDPAVCATRIVAGKMLAPGGTVTTNAECRDDLGVVAWSACAGGDLVTVSADISGWAPITPVLSPFVSVTISASTTEAYR